MGQIEPKQIRRGVCHGSLSSPGLFNAYEELMMVTATGDCTLGFKVNGQRIGAITFADDEDILWDKEY